MADPEGADKKFQRELNAGTVSLILLSVLGRTEEPLYGYQILKRIEATGPDLPMMKQGALYPVLRSLEKNDLLKSRVEPSVSGPPRRYYSITDRGREALRRWSEIWNRNREFVDSVLEGAYDVGSV